MQGIAAQVLLHHQFGSSVRGEAIQPSLKQHVQVLLADPNWRIRNDEIESQVGWYVVGLCDRNIKPESIGIGCAQVAGPSVHIDGPDLGVWIASRHRARDGTVATADIEDHLCILSLGRLNQQHPRTGVDLGRREHTAVDIEFQGKIRQMERYSTNIAGDRGIVVEVVAATSGRRLSIRFVSGHLRRVLRGVYRRSRCSGPGNNLEPVDVMMQLMSTKRIRTYGDPVLNTKASDVTDIDGKFVKLCDDMFVAMYDAPGIGLAAPQVGVQKRFFVYDYDETPGVLINPVVTESDGEWEYSEGCLSVPGMSFDIVRPKQILVSGIDLDGNDVTIEADELFSRLIQHEIDHLDGVLLLEHLDDDQRREALKELQDRKLAAEAERATKSAVGGLQLP